MTSATLLTIHGMAGIGRLWDDVTNAWDGPSISPSLAGHGLAPRLDAYGPASFADELVERSELSADSGPLVVAGHSLGGVVAMELIRRHPDLDVGHLVIIGVKTEWPDADVAGSHAVADKGVRWFDDEASARKRFALVAGVADRIDPSDERLADGAVEENGSWRTATDPEAFRVDRNMNFDDLFGSVRCGFTVARGADDQMVPGEDLARFGHPVVDIPSAGHNAHVDNPAAVLEIISDAASS